ncbi:MAG: SPOR domain-containing protein [Colwellia sp.]
MAHQDYVSREKAKKNKKNPYKPKKATRKNSRKSARTANHSSKTKVVGVITCSLIIGAAIGLWQLKNNPLTKDAVATDLHKKTIGQTTPQEVNDKAMVKKDSKELPSLPDEQWTYVDELQKEKEIVGEYEVKENGPYKMVCGSFKQRSRAEKVKAQMAFIGIESIIQTSKNGATTWHKVALGPYTKKRMAEKDKHMLKNNKITGCQIWLWR